MKKRTSKSQNSKNFDDSQSSKTLKSQDFDSSKTESFGSVRNSEEFRHAQKFKTEKRISDTSEEIKKRRKNGI